MVGSVSTLQKAGDVHMLVSACSLPEKYHKRLMGTICTKWRERIKSYSASWKTWVKTIWPETIWLAEHILFLLSFSLDWSGWDCKFFFLSFYTIRNMSIRNSIYIPEDFPCSVATELLIFCNVCMCVCECVCTHTLTHVAACDRGS